jgi:hypothetical protein
LEDCVRHADARLPGPAAQGTFVLPSRTLKEDLIASRAVHDFLLRIRAGQHGQLLELPHFAPTAASPGLQAAGLVAYLAAHQHDPAFRPELRPYWAAVAAVGT